MSFYLDEFVSAFWEAFRNCKSKHSYKFLLEKLELMTTEYLSQLEGEEYKSFYDNSPFLAMISEVELVCPEAVYELAEENPVFSTAAYIISTYKEKDRKFLRWHFLGKNDDNVVQIDFDKRKRAD
jgi:hypothetical protein